MESIQRGFFLLHLGGVLVWSAILSLRYYLGEIVVVMISISLALGGLLGQFSMHGQELERLKIAYLNQPSFSHFQALLGQIHRQDTISARLLLEREGRAWSDPQMQQLVVILDQTGFLKKERAFWESVLKEQPTHREVLWNLRTLELGLQNTTKAAEYEQQARKVDPNFEFSE